MSALTSPLSLFPSSLGVALFAQLDPRLWLDDAMASWRWFAVLGAVVALILVVRMLIITRFDDPRRIYYANKLAMYLLFLLGLVAGLAVFLEGSADLATTIGFIGAGLALALHRVLASILGWLVVLSTRLYRTGDRIQIGEVMGDVIDIGIFRTAMMEVGNWVGDQQTTGRIVTVPNCEIFESSCFNWTHGSHHIWNEISLVFTFSSHWRKAEEILLEAVKEIEPKIIEEAKKGFSGMTRSYDFKMGKLTSVVWMRICDHGVELTLRFLTEARQKRVTVDIVSRNIMDAVQRTPDVEFAYPTHHHVISQYRTGQTPISPRTISTGRFRPELSRPGPPSQSPPPSQPEAERA